MSKWLGKNGILDIFGGIRGLFGKYPANLNISRTDRMTLIYVSSQSEKTLLCIINSHSSVGLVSRQ
jgi:hypothetical protein